MRVIFLFIIMFFMNEAQAFTLTVKLDNLSSDKGLIQYLVFSDEKGFPDKEEASVLKGSLPVSQIGTELSFPNLPKGTYAISLFHDENSNGKLDLNFLGIPKEDFGFSNNPKIFFGPPSFNKCSFELNSDQTVTIALKGLL